jgi:hypothetical protein
METPPTSFNPLQWASVSSRQLILYMPYVLVLFGFIRDIIYEDLRYSIASLIGIASVIVNYLFGLIGQSIIGAPIPQPAVNPGDLNSGLGCGVPGFQALDSIFAPQAIVLPVSFLAYILIDLASNRDALKNIGISVLFGVLPIIQSLILFLNNCFSKYYFGNKWFGIPMILIALIIGTGSGALGYLAVYKIRPTALPSQENLPTTNRNFGTTQKMGVNEQIITIGEKSKQSEPVDDNDQFVCEAYKDGELVTSTVVG